MSQELSRLRVNFQIRVPQVRIIKDGQQLGVMPTEKARNIAFDEGLDLVEMVPNAHPPVCHIIDFSKYKYEQKMKIKENNKRQREMAQVLKEIRLSPAIDQHDLDIKIKHIIEFLQDDKKVQITMKFRSRELQNKSTGVDKVNMIIDKCKELCCLELQPKFEGSRLVCRLAPRLIKDSFAK